MVDLVKGVNAFFVAGSAKSTASDELSVALVDKKMPLPFVIVNKNGRVPVREMWVRSFNKSYSRRDPRHVEYKEKQIVICAASESRVFLNTDAPSILMRSGDRIVENAYIFSSEEKLDDAIALQEYLKTPEALARNQANEEEYERYLHESTHNRTYRW